MPDPSDPEHLTNESDPPPLTTAETTSASAESDQGVDDLQSNVDLRLMARQIYNSRLDRGKFFNSDLLSEAVWNMLLAVYSLSRPSQPLTESELARAADCPYSTALRWIESMIEENLIERCKHPDDMRATYVRLTPVGSKQMDDYMMHLAVRSHPGRID